MPTPLELQTAPHSKKCACSVGITNVMLILWLCRICLASHVTCRIKRGCIADLKVLGVKLCSVYEQSVDDSASGTLTANIHGTFNQYFSDALSEKMKDRMRASAAAGRFPWRAPIGYVNTG